MALPSVVGTAKTAVKRGNPRTPAAPARSAPSPRRTASSTTESSRAASPAQAATPRGDRNRYFDVVVLISVFVFIVLAAGVGLLVLEQATSWRI